MALLGSVTHTSGASGMFAQVSEGTQLPRDPLGDAVSPIEDLNSRWEKIAEAEYAKDGATEGWSSDDDAQHETSDMAFIKKHPDVPVVENLEDLWKLSKLQQERKARQKKSEARAGHVMRDAPPLLPQCTQQALSS
ncbi:unnamed protein product [Ostreobium quekettii]|uniref:Uncharacterized protein n=1 Tax=Ostreobium quekettii TaxID=121088 RepID=A0A8S1J607_9CHLO|nr:unnamed protein product [Ostreobium quekettii]